MDIRVAIFINSAVDEYYNFENYILPNIRNFGISYKLIDVSNKNVEVKLEQYPLIVIGHYKAINIKDNINVWLDYIKGGGGLVSFDPYFTLINELIEFEYKSVSGTYFKFSNMPHYILSSRCIGEKIQLENRVTPNSHIDVLHAIEIKKDTKVLLCIGENPYLMVKEIGKGKFVQWMGYTWMFETIRGPIWGVDDLLWRSLIWAARKPFILRELPNFATIRVDDCVGDHGFYKQHPFLWVEIANKYGFIPWLGFFHENLSKESFEKMKELVELKKANAQFHGVFLFGKVYKQYDSSEEISQYINNWFEKYSGRIPLSKYFIPHAYDFSSQAVSAIKKLGVEFIGMPYEIDSGGGVKNKDTPWLKAGPFRSNLEGIDGTPWVGDSLNRPIYYADWYRDVNGSKMFFNLLTEIRDVNGYEWFNYSADNSQYADKYAAIKRGTEIFKRCYDSKIFGNLFTHEDSWRGRYISNIEPEIWEEIIAGISSNIARYNPVYVTIDEAAECVRDLHTSTLESGQYRYNDNSLELNFSGETLRESQISVFNEKNHTIYKDTYKISAFKGKKNKKLHIDTSSYNLVDSIFQNESVVSIQYSTKPIMLGTRFYILISGYIDKVRLYTTSGDCGTHKISIWRIEDNKCLVHDLKWVIESDNCGWKEVELAAPLRVEANKEYAVCISTVLENREKYTFASLTCGFYFPMATQYLYSNRGSGIRSDSFDEIPLSSDDEYNCYFRDIIFRADKE